MPDYDSYIGSFETLMQAALGVLAAERAPRTAHYEMHRQAAEERMALAAQALTRATDNLPEDQRPLGWDGRVRMHRAAALADPNGIVAVKHRLNSENVEVQCLNALGMPIGYRAVNVISPDEVEVATVPGSGVSVVLVTAIEPVAA